MIQDHIVAVTDILKADSGVASLVGSRVFGIELPKAETQHMPRKAIVVKQSGGIGSRDYIRHSNPRIDVFCYGETPYEARKLRREVYDVLQQLKRTVINSTLVHWFNPSGGPLDLRDPETQWSLCFESYDCYMADQAVA